MKKIYTRHVVFGDCDPAGIVYYPQMFTWMDAGFHHVLGQHGGHAALCKRLGAKGLGLVSASAVFKRPLTDGDAVDICIDNMVWGAKTLEIHYAGRVADTVHFTGTETRCMFVVTDDGMRAGEVSELRDIMVKP